MCIRARASAGLDLAGGSSDLLNRQQLLSLEPFGRADSMQLFAALNSVAAAGQVSPVPVLGELNGEKGCFALRLAATEAASEEGLAGAQGAKLMIDESILRANVMYQVWIDTLWQGSNVHVPPAYAN